MTLSQFKNLCIYALRAEIRWCKKDPDPFVTKEYREGFMNGLRQAEFLIKQAYEVAKKAKVTP